MMEDDGPVGFNPELSTPLSTQPQSGLSVLSPPVNEVKEALYDPTLINQSVPKPKFGGSFDNIYPTTPAPLSQTTPRFNSIGDPLYGSDPSSFNPNDLGFVADQALLPEQNLETQQGSDASTFANVYNDTTKLYGDTGGGGGGYGDFGQGTRGALDVRPPPPDYQQILKNQILGQNLTSNWRGGHGAQDAANDMAKLMADAGITDIKQFGKIPTYEKAEIGGYTYNGTRVQDMGDGRYIYQEPTGETQYNFDSGTSEPVMRTVTVPKGAKLEPLYGKTSTVQDGEFVNTFFEPTDPSQIVMKDGVPMYKTGETFGNKVTGQAINRGSGRWERQGGEGLFSGTGAGKGNTGFRVQFGDDGTPYFYTTAGSSSDLNKIAPLLAIAQFIPGLQPFAMAANAAIAASQGNVLGALAGAAGLGGFSDVANAANFAGAVKSGNPLGILSSGANLGGTDLSGVANSAGLGDLNNIGGYNVNDIAKAYQGVKAIQSGDPSAIISTVGGYMNNQGDQRPASPLDSLVPSGYFDVASDGSSNASPVASSDIPSDTSSGALPSIEEPTSNAPVEMPIDSAIGGVNPYEIPSVVSNPMESPQAPAVDQQKDLSDKSFKSAFAQARASGDKEFLWNGNVYNTNLAPTLNAGPASNRTINTGAGMNPDALAGWGGSKVDPNLIKAAAPYLGWDPSTYFPKVDVRMADPTSALGNVPETGYKSNQQTYINMAPYVTGLEPKYPGTTADVLSHELAHVGQVLTSKPGEDISKQYLRMANEAGMSFSDRFNKPSDITNFDRTLNDSIDYINKTYGTTAGTYLGNPKAPLFEKLTDLAAIEMQTGKDLTQDPVLKETLFKDPKAVAMYNTMTIPRMSRLDPRDLPPGRVTESDFPKGQVPLEFRIKNMIRGKR